MGENYVAIVGAGPDITSMKFSALSAENRHQSDMGSDILHRRPSIRHPS